MTRVCVNRSDMNDTYAVVNKPKQPAAAQAHSAAAPPGHSRYRTRGAEGSGSAGSLGSDSCSPQVLAFHSPLR